MESEGAVPTSALPISVHALPFDDQAAPGFSIYDLRCSLVREYLREARSTLADQPNDREIYRAMRLVHRSGACATRPPT
jgi:hypothetical protein